MPDLPRDEHPSSFTDDRPTPARAGRTRLVVLLALLFVVVVLAGLVGFVLAMRR